MNKPVINRRQIIQLIIGLGASSNGLSHHLLANTQDGAFIKKPFFDGLSVNPATLKRFIDAYLDTKPKSTTQSAIEHEMFGKDGDRPNLEKITDIIASKISHDFVTDNTVSLHGWVFSRTEVQVWYIYYLLLQNT